MPSASPGKNRDHRVRSWRRLLVIDFGAGGENRTRDIQLGKLTFYL